MFKQIYRHLLAPKLAHISASAAAERLGLKTFEVIGSNMAPTLEPRDIAWFAPVVGVTGLRRGYVVALRIPEFGPAIVPSRVVGLPGETVEICGGALLVNGRAIPEPYLDPARAEQDYSLNFEPVTVPSGHVWLLGDFRDMSKDSRHLGPIPISAVLGRITNAHLPGVHTDLRKFE